MIKNLHHFQSKSKNGTTRKRIWVYLHVWNPKDKPRWQPWGFLFPPITKISSSWPRGIRTMVSHVFWHCYFIQSHYIGWNHTSKSYHKSNLRMWKQGGGWINDIYQALSRLKRSAQSNQIVRFNPNHIRFIEFAYSIITSRKTTGIIPASPRSIYTFHILPRFQIPTTIIAIPIQKPTVFIAHFIPTIRIILPTRKISIIYWRLTISRIWHFKITKLNCEWFKFKLRCYISSNNKNTQNNNKNK